MTYNQTEVYAIADKARESIQRQGKQFTCLCFALFLMLIAVRVFAPESIAAIKPTLSTQAKDAPDVREAPAFLLSAVTAKKP